ncbi:MAG: hypothetical protein N3F07_04380, partial [Candidatus Micrarchaeota archaeon]|nr:hypothetical protein [Candidatus Micrarchaeota archaeon]
AQPSTSKQERQTLPTERVRKALEEMKEENTKAEPLFYLFSILGLFSILALGFGVYLYLKAKNR